MSHANRGRLWQAKLAAQHRRYLDDGVACVWEQSPKLTVTGTSPRGKVSGFLSGHGPPDFGGIVHPSLAVCFDAKKTNEPRWSFHDLVVRGGGRAASRNANHQAEAFDAFQRAGGFAFIAARIQGESYVLPWAMIGPMWWRWRHHGGKPASVRPDPFWRFEEADWLPVVRSMAGLRREAA